MSPGSHGVVRGAALVCATLLACTEIDAFNVYPEPPADVRFVYAAVQDEEGRLEVTSMLPWPEARFELNGRAGLARWLIGYSDSTKEVEAAVHRPLRAAPKCEPALPPGSWCQRVGDDPSEVPQACSPVDAPPVTFEGLEALRRCTNAVAIRVGCDDQELDCAWTLDGTDCRFEATTCSILPRFSFAIDGIARACELEVPVGCSAIVAEGALGGIECLNAAGACSAELHAVPQVPWLQVAERIRLVDAEPRLPPNVAEGSSPLYRPELELGHVYDLALVDGRLHVAIPSRAGAPAWYGPPFDGLTGSVFRVLEPDGRLLAESAFFRENTISVEAIGDEMISLMGFAPVSLWLRRFDRDGALLNERSIDCRSLGLPVTVMRAELAGDGARLFLSIGAHDRGASEGGSVLFELDPTTLSTVAAVRFLSPPEGVAARMISTLAVDGNRILLGDEENDSHVWLDAGTFEKIAEVPAHGTGEHLPVRQVGERGIAALLGGTRPGFDIVDLGRTDAVRVSRFEVPGQPTGLGPWPGRADWASAATSADLRVHVGPVDLAGLRVLVGAVDVGFGVGTRIRSDGGAGLWVLLPWAGEAVRLTPR